MPPCVQDHSGAGLGPQKPVILGKSAQGMPGCLEEQVITESIIVHAPIVELRREGKNNMVIPDGQKLLAASLNPKLSFEPATLGTMAIAAGIIADADHTASGAGIEMPTQSSGTATFQR